MNRKWKSYVATEHTKEYHGQFEWLHLKRVHISPYMYERKVRKVLQINKLRAIIENDKTTTIWNRVNGDKSWQILEKLFMKMGHH